MKTRWVKARNIRPGESIETTAGVRKVVSVSRGRDCVWFVLADLRAIISLRHPIDHLLSRVGPSITSRSHPAHPKECLRACCKYRVP